MSEVEHILASRNVLGEGPLWSVDEQALYWVDINAGTYFRFHPATGAQEAVYVGTPIGVLGLRASGGLIMAVKDGFALWDATLQELHYLAKPEEGKPGIRFNDGAVDCGGRFWAGSMDIKEEADLGTLWRLDPDGSVHAMLTGICVSNGIGWNPDNTLMYFVDSPKRIIYAFDFDAPTGNIANQRTFVHTPEDPSFPDGLTVDSEGFVWCAYWNGAKIVRYDPTGEVDRVISVPAPRTTACVFGGPNLDELYITSAQIGLTDEQKKRYPLSGDLFHLKTGIKGQEKYKFAG